MDVKRKITYYSSAAVFGGAEQYLSILIGSLDRERFSASLAISASPALGPLKEKLLRTGVAVHHVEPIKGKYDWANFYRQYKFFRGSRPDILHINLPILYHSQLTILAAKLAGVPKIVATQHLAVRSITVNARQRFLENISSRFLDRIIAVAESGKNVMLERLPVGEDRIVVIHNGIDLAEKPAKGPSAIRESLGIPPDVPIVGTIGRLTGQKGLTYFLEAASVLKKEFGRIKFILVGDGPLREELERYACKQGLGRDVIFTGQREDIVDILGTMDIFVLSSLYEGFPLTILEAMAMKKPVVATRVDGVPEAVLDGKTGILVPPENPGALAGAVAPLLKDKAKAAEMGEAGFERMMKHFSAETMVKKTQDIYDEILRR